MLRDLGTTAQANEFLRAFFGNRKLVIIEASEVDGARGVAHENLRLRTECERLQREAAGYLLQFTTQASALSNAEERCEVLNEDLANALTAVKGGTGRRRRAAPLDGVADAFFPFCVQS